MFREYLKSCLRYRRDKSCVSRQLSETLKTDIQRDLNAAFELAGPLIEERPDLYRESSTFLDFLFKWVEATPPPSESIADPATVGLFSDSGKTANVFAASLSCEVSQLLSELREQKLLRPPSTGSEVDEKLEAMMKRHCTEIFEQIETRLSNGGEAAKELRTLGVSLGKQMEELAKVCEKKLLRLESLSKDLERVASSLQAPARATRSDAEMETALFTTLQNTTVELMELLGGFRQERLELFGPPSDLELQQQQQQPCVASPTISFLMPSLQSQQQQQPTAAAAAAAAASTIHLPFSLREQLTGMQVAIRNDFSSMMAEAKAAVTVRDEELELQRSMIRQILDYLQAHRGQGREEMTSYAAAALPASDSVVCYDDSERATGEVETLRSTVNDLRDELEEASRKIRKCEDELRQRDETIVTVKADFEEQLQRQSSTSRDEAAQKIGEWEKELLSVRGEHTREMQEKDATIATMEKMNEELERQLSTCNNRLTAVRKESDEKILELQREIEWFRERCKGEQTFPTQIYARLKSFTSRKPHDWRAARTTRRSGTKVSESVGGSSREDDRPMECSVYEEGGEMAGMTIMTYLMDRDPPSSSMLVPRDVDEAIRRLRELDDRKETEMRELKARISELSTVGEFRSIGLSAMIELIRHHNARHPDKYVDYSIVGIESFQADCCDDDDPLTETVKDLETRDVSLKSIEDSLRQNFGVDTTSDAWFQLWLEDRREEEESVKAQLRTLGLLLDRTLETENFAEAITLSFEEFEIERETLRKINQILFGESSVAAEAGKRPSEIEDAVSELYAFKQLVLGKLQKLRRNSVLGRRQVDSPDATSVATTTTRDLLDFVDDSFEILKFYRVPNFSEEEVENVRRGVRNRVLSSADTDGGELDRLRRFEADVVKSIGELKKYYPKVGISTFPEELRGVYEAIFYASENHHVELQVLVYAISKNVSALAGRLLDVNFFNFGELVDRQYEDCKDIILGVLNEQCTPQTRELSDCEICSGTIEEGYSSYMFRCRHIFHKRCIRTHLDTSLRCRTCKSLLVPDLDGTPCVKKSPSSSSGSDGIACESMEAVECAASAKRSLDAVAKEVFETAAAAAAAAVDDEGGGDIRTKRLKKISHSDSDGDHSSSPPEDGPEPLSVQHGEGD